MLGPTQQFHLWPFDMESELEMIIAAVKAALFGERRSRRDVKKRIVKITNVSLGKQKRIAALPAPLLS